MDTRRRAQCCRFAFAQFEQCPRQWRYPANQTASGVSLIHPDNTVNALTAAAVANRYRRAEEYLLAFPAPCRIDHLGLLQTLAQEPHTAINLAQAFFAVDIVAIFRAVAVGSRPSNH